MLCTVTVPYCTCSLYSFFCPANFSFPFVHFLMQYFLQIVRHDKCCAPSFGLAPLLSGLTGGFFVCLYGTNGGFKKASPAVLPTKRATILSKPVGSVTFDHRCNRSSSQCLIRFDQKRLGGLIRVLYDSMKLPSSVAY